MAEHRPSAEDIVNLLLAKGNAQRLQFYLERGRRFKDLSEEELSLKYVEGMREWAASPTVAASRKNLNDVDAEYGLRNLEPPSDKTKIELETIIAAMESVHEGLSDDRIEEINDDMCDEYESAKKGQH